MLKRALWAPQEWGLGCDCLLYIPCSYTLIDQGQVEVSGHRWTYKVGGKLRSVDTGGQTNKRQAEVNGHKQTDKVGRGIPISDMYVILTVYARNVPSLGRISILRKGVPYPHCLCRGRSEQRGGRTCLALSVYFFGVLSTAKHLYLAILGNPIEMNEKSLP